MTNLISADEKKDRNLAFGMRLKAHRQELKITQEELAESVGKSSETISKLERGLVYPGVDMLILLAERLDTTLDSLVGTQSTISMSKKQSALMAQAASTLNTMSEDKLKVAVKQLKALQEL
jgi:transcriptional regulator with XRE-family HTH domain